MRVCAGAHMIKFEMCELSAFTGRKINKFGQKAKILGKNENAHEIRKKGRFMSGRDNSIFICGCHLQHRFFSKSIFNVSKGSATQNHIIIL